MRRDELKKPNWDSAWIQSILPHRYPFLLVDRVLELEPGESIVALKNFTINEEFFQGHFPGHPVVPGVLLLEALAQAGAILILQGREDRDSKLFYFAGVERARFRLPVVPGDQARLEVKILRLRRAICKIEGKVYVDGKLTTEAVLTSAMVEKD